MKLISRIKNVVDLRENLIVLDNVKNFPVFMGCVLHDPEDDICGDLTWAISKNTGVIQLTKLIPLDILNNINSSAIFWE